jgi:hypothetical protein
LVGAKKKQHQLVVAHAEQVISQLKHPQHVELQISRKRNRVHVVVHAEHLSNQKRNQVHVAAHVEHLTNKKICQGVADSRQFFRRESLQYMILKVLQYSIY